jgi:hypothetical protein
MLMAHSSWLTTNHAICRFARLANRPGCSISSA